MSIQVFFDIAFHNSGEVSGIIYSPYSKPTFIVRCGRIVDSRSQATKTRLHSTNKDSSLFISIAVFLLIYTKVILFARIDKYLYLWTYRRCYRHIRLWLTHSGDKCPLDRYHRHTYHRSWSIPLCVVLLSRIKLKYNFRAMVKPQIMLFSTASSLATPSVNMEAYNAKYHGRCRLRRCGRWVCEEIVYSNSKNRNDTPLKRVIFI